MRTKLIILPILLIMAAFSVSATSFYVSQEPIKENIFISEVAEFDLTITNMLTTPDVLTFSTQDPSWILLTQQAAITTGVDHVTLKIDPGSQIPLGIYVVNVKIKSAKSGEFKNELFQINIRPYDPIFGEYRPSIQFSATIDKQVDPRNKVPISVFMKNRNALDISEMQVLIDGKLFYKEFAASLGPLEEKRTEYLFEIDSTQEPGLYPLNVQLIVKNVTISQSTQNYEVIAYSDVSSKLVPESFFFKTTQVITVENDGNTKKTETISIPMPLIKRIFTYSDIKGTSAKIGGEPVLQWDVTIEPQELVTINVTTNYRIPIGIIILAIVILILYYSFRSPVLMTKEAIVTVISAEEGVEHLKLRLFVKNRSKNPIDRVTVFDRVPGIAEVLKTKTLGTIHPEKITKQEKKGTIIKWNLENLEPFEERIITYEIKSKLKIIGNISLPGSRATFLDKKKERTIYSNRVMVSG
ncbi:MAG: hypothetical protein ABH828_00730 [archaeon]